MTGSAKNESLPPTSRHARLWCALKTISIVGGQQVKKGTKPRGKVDEYHAVIRLGVTVYLVGIFLVVRYCIGNTNQGRLKQQLNSWKAYCNDVYQNLCFSLNTHWFALRITIF